ncbi:MAG: translocation/assembly module TamB domain-containing protein [Myxococcota bacterium]|nr:translocation/assembly module TamB domain-containing protein [Myxococcota bacterium]
MVRAVGRWMIRGSLAFALLCLAVLTWLRSAGGSEWMRVQILAAIEPQMARGKVTLEGVKTDLLRSFQLVGLEFQDESTRVVRVDTMAVTVDPWTVLSGRIGVSSLVIDGLTADLVTDETGKVNLGALFEGSDAPAPPAGPYQGIGVNLSIDAIDVSATSLTLDGTGIGAVRINAAVDIDGSTVAIRDLRAVGTMGEPVDGVVSLDGNATLRGGDLHLEDVRLSDGANQIGFSGSIMQVETDPVMDLSVHLVALDPAGIELLVGEPLLSETISGVVGVTGTTTAVKAEGRLSGESQDGSLALSATMALDRDPIAWSVHLAPADLSVDALTPLVPADTRLNGTVRIDGAGSEFPEGVRATIEADFGVQRLAGHSIDAARFRADLAEGLLTVHDAHATDGNSTMTASGVADLVQSTAAIRFNARALNARGLHQYGAPRMAGGLEIGGEMTADWVGDLNADVKTRWRGEGIEMDGRSVDGLRGSANAVFRGEAFRATTDAVVEGVRADGMTVARVNVNGSVSGEASGARDATFTLNIGAAELPDAELALGSIVGQVRMQIDPMGRPSGAGDFQVSNAQYGAQYSVDGGPVAVAIDGDRVDVDIDLRRNSAPFLAGSLSGDLATGEWSLDGFELAILKSKGFASAGPMGFTLTEDGARDVDVRVISPDGLGEFAITGVVEPDEPNFAIKASGIRLGAVRDLVQGVLGEGVLGEPMLDADGVLSMDVSVTSNPGEPPAASGWMELHDLMAHEWVDGVKLRLDAAMNHDEATAEVSIEGREALLLWSKASIGLVKDSGTIRPRCDGPFRWRSIVPAARLRDVQRSLPFIGPSANGQVSFDMALGGLVCSPTAEIYGAVDAPVGVNGERVRLDLAAAKNDESVSIGVTASQEGRSLAQVTVELETMAQAVLKALVEGSPLDDAAKLDRWIETVDAKLELTDTDVSRLARMAGVSHSVSGLLNGRIALQGALSRPLMSGTIELNEGHVGEASVDVLRASITPEDGELAVEAQARFDDGGHVTAVGRVATDGMDVRAMAEQRFAPPIALELSGAGVPIAVAAGPSGLTDAHGLLAVSGRIGGTVDSPMADIRLQAAEAAFTVIPTGLRYEPVELDLRFMGQTIRLDRVHVSATPTWGLNPKPGTVDVKGTVGLGSAPSLDIRTALDGFWVSSTRSAELATSGAISIRGSYPNLSIGGDLAIDTADIVVGPDAFKDASGLEVDPIVTIHRERRAVVERERPSAQSDFEQMRVDLNIDLGQAVRLRADVPMSEEFGQKFSQLATMSVDLGLDGALHVTQDNRTLSVVGELETRRGEATAFGKRFGIQQGTVTFTGEDVANPQLRLDASHRVGQYGTVDIAIGGDVDNTRMDLSSPEYPDETDVMSMLLFGKPTAAMSETEGESGAGLLTAAMASAGGKAARATGAAFLQNVQIDPGSGAVKVGFPLTDKVYLSIQRVSPDTDTDNMTQAAVEWILSRSTYGEVVTGDRGQSSGDLYWRWRF